VALRPRLAAGLPFRGRPHGTLFTEALRGSHRYIREKALSAARLPPTSGGPRALRPRLAAGLPFRGRREVYPTGRLLRYQNEALGWPIHPSAWKGSSPKGISNMPHRPDHSRPARPIGDRALIPLDHTTWEDRIKLRDLV